MRFGQDRRALGLARTMIVVTCLATALACGGSAPELAAIDDQVVAVGDQLVIELRATDQDGDDIDYSYTAEVADIDARATLTKSPAGYGVFQWTPQAADVGEWFFDFTASDGGDEVTVTVRIDVRSATGSDSAPLFRSPLGTGTTLDLTRDECLDLDIIVEDQDSASVVIAQEEPIIEGATLEETSGLTSAWRWCPTRAQAEAEDRYTLSLSADDQSNPKTIKNYLVVLRGDIGTNCPGAAPVILHSASDATTLVDLTLDARVTDDKGLKQPPLLYYSTSPIAADPDLGAMTQVSMLLIDGSMQDGTWAADVPNPAVGGGAGSMAELYYVIVADDDDDEVGNCDHVTQSSNFQMTVTNPGGTGNAGLCESCSADIQCGSGDLCVRVGAAQIPYCLESCTTGSCPAGYTCSSSPVTSVGGASARQCVPNAGSCTGGGVCVDDSYEQNDTRAQAQAQPALAPGSYDFTSCPASGGTDDDEDWFRIDLAASARINVAIDGGAASDLDLGVYKPDGSRVSTSTSLQPDEMITTCQPAGTYYFRVYSWDFIENDYNLTWSRTAETCAACVDDGQEDDDTSSQARTTALPITSTMNKICPNDADTYRVPVSAGDRIIVDLDFAQASAAQDLDLHLLDPAGVDTTPCSFDDPFLCDTANGQGVDADEHAEYVIPASCGGSCNYYVQVVGWNGARNDDYDITITVQ
ncbi:MAG: PPC domain-containing protein [Kofleriaceae bacterium]|jgi:hypothetical protein|nr:PPC domain-containing protein [Kofleriaceae bacterium]MBP6836572.1 PPC domain-containing protein [Kofleriaceae bacterium]